jgi:hypothetical protein
MRVASEMAFACCFFRLGWLNMPALAGRGENPFGAGGVCKTHFQNSPHIWVIGIRRRALSVFPKWISSLPSVTFSGLRRKHSSGLRVPQGLRLCRESRTNGRKSPSANSRSVAAGFRSRIPTSPFAKAALFAASICSATRLFVCFVVTAMRFDPFSGRKRPVFLDEHGKPIMYADVEVAA